MTTEKKEVRRVRIVHIEPELLMNLFTATHPVFIVEGLPKDVKFRGFSHDWNQNRINLFVEHDSFDEIEIGTIPPENRLVIQALFTAKEALEKYPQVEL